MEIKKDLNVSAAAFFEKLSNSVIYDIFQSTGERLQPVELEGKSYFKLYTKNSGSTITITKFQNNERYAYEALTSRNSFSADYHIESTGDNTCRVTYTEKMISYEFMQKLNDAILGTMLSGLKKRRFKKMLTAIEESC